MYYDNWKLYSEKNGAVEIGDIILYLKLEAGGPVTFLNRVVEVHSGYLRVRDGHGRIHSIASWFSLPPLLAEIARANV